MHLLSLEEYGLRCLLQVASAPGPEPRSIAEIADAEGLSAEYTAKLMRKLRLGGLVTSARGASGGYRLARPASEITVWDALSVLGGEFFPEGFCACHGGRRPECVRMTDCSLRALWRRLGASLRTELGRVTLRDLQRAEPDMVALLDRRRAEGSERWQ